jgi:hypothetical protein
VKSTPVMVAAKVGARGVIVRGVEGGDVACGIVDGAYRVWCWRWVGRCFGLMYWDSSAEWTSYQGLLDCFRALMWSSRIALSCSYSSYICIINQEVENLLLVGSQENDNAGSGNFPRQRV